MTASGGRRIGIPIPGLGFPLSGPRRKRFLEYPAFKLSFVQRFDTSLERQFRQDYFERSHRAARLALAVGMVLWAAFGVLDKIMLNEIVWQLWLIRYGIVLPIIAGVLVFTMTCSSDRQMQPALTLMVMAAGYGILVMILIAFGRDRHLYYAGVMLVTFFAYTFLRLRFVWATAACWSMVLSYELIAWTAGAPVRILINNNFFFITANIIGMSACYSMEYFARRDFLQRRQVEAASAAARMEISRIAALQRSLLPRDLPQIPGLALAVYYTSCNEAGGDLYDLRPVGDGHRWALLIGDVSGHGASAAVIMAMTQAVFRACEHISASPAEVISHLNRQLTRNLKAGFVTAFVGVYDPRDRSLIYCRAGHEMPVLKTNNQCIYLDGPAGLPLGLQQDEEYPEAQVTLDPGQVLLLYTDGVRESRGQTGKLFGLNSIRSVVAESDVSAPSVVNSLVKALALHQQGQHPGDDQCILAVQVI